MGLLLLLVIVYLVAKNLEPKKNTIVVDGKVIEELPSLDGTLVTPAALANQGVIENENARVEALLSTLSLPAKSVTINPAVSPAAVIERNTEQASEAYQQCLENIKKKMAGGPVIENPEAFCRQVFLQIPKIAV